MTAKRRPASIEEAATELPAGAAYVVTQPVELVDRLLTQIVESERPEILQCVGPAGSGKTTSVERWLALHPEIEVVRILLSDLAKGYAVLRETLSLLGESTGGTSLELRQRAVAVLRRRKILIYIDEANEMNRQALRHFRYLYDYKEDLKDANGRVVRRVKPLRFGLVLVGTDFAAAWRLAPEVRSRVDCHVRFGRIADRTLVKTLAAYHPLFAKTPAVLLRRIDAERCQGEWRWWCRFLRDTLERYPATTQVSEEIAADILGVGGAAD